MKHLIASFIFFYAMSAAKAQTVISSCSAPGNIQALYMDDADRIALQRIYQQNLTFKDSIVIPQNYTDTLLKALLAVYNATALPARNAVVSIYNIHTFPYPVLNRLNLAADSNLLWMKQLKLGNTVTGNAQVDQLISTYGLSIQNYNRYYGMFPYHLVSFQSDSNYNMVPLTDMFDNIPGVAFSETLSVIGDGNNISATIFPGYVALTYSIGWGDCPAGCTSRHFWQFKVNADCSVMYLGESGTPIPVPATPTIVITGSNCTNQTLTVSISSASSSSLNNQPLQSSQFTLSSTTPTIYVINATNVSYPGYAASSASVSIINCNVSVTSVPEQSVALKTSVYPNPVRETLFFNASTHDQMHVVITDILGKIVLKKDIEGHDSLMQIDVSTIPKGIYLFTLGSETRRFVKE